MWLMETQEKEIFSKLKAVAKDHKLQCNAIYDIEGGYWRPIAQASQPLLPSSEFIAPIAAKHGGVKRLNIR